MVRLYDMTHRNSKLCYESVRSFAEFACAVVGKSEYSDKKMAKWYKSFLGLAIYYLKRECNFDEFTFESLVKLCRTTKWRGGASVFDVLITDYEKHEITDTEKLLLAEWNVVKFRRPSRAAKRLEQAVEYIEEFKGLGQSVPSVRNRRWVYRVDGVTDHMGNKKSKQLIGYCLTALKMVEMVPTEGVLATWYWVGERKFAHHRGFFHTSLVRGYEEIEDSVIITTMNSIYTLKRQNYNITILEEI